MLMTAIISEIRKFTNFRIFENRETPRIFKANVAWAGIEPAT
jgi:hypothetical protein